MIIASLSIKEGLASGVGQRCEKSAQIALLCHPTEHLRNTEGLDVAAVA